jgi:hypothetical protein
MLPIPASVDALHWSNVSVPTVPSAGEAVPLPVIAATVVQAAVSVARA